MHEQTIPQEFPETFTLTIERGIMEEAIRRNRREGAYCFIHRMDHFAYACNCPIALAAHQVFPLDTITVSAYLRVERGEVIAYYKMTQEARDLMDMFDTNFEKCPDRCLSAEFPVSLTFTLQRSY